MHYRKNDRIRSSFQRNTIIFIYMLVFIWIRSYLDVSKQ